MINAVVDSTDCLTARVKALLASMLTFVMFGCGNAPVQTPGSTHLRAEKVGAGETATIPAPVQQMLALPKPKATPKAETYSVVVNNVRVAELLFALARDAKLNVDIHPGIEGMVTLNAIDQTLQQLLNRIAKQVDLRWELDGPNLSVMQDKPFLRTYKIDFPNMARIVKSTIATTTQIASAATSAGGSGGSGNNSASTMVTSDTKNDLMESLISNVTDMLKEEDKLRYRTAIEIETRNQASTEGSGQITAALSSGSKTKNQDGSSTEAAGPGGVVAGRGSQSIQGKADAVKKIGEYEPSVSVFANRETGVLIVRASSRQHEKVQQFIDQVMNTAKRQVLIEATIAEVRLKDGYQQGIEWNRLSLSGLGFQLAQRASGEISAPASSLLQIGYTSPDSPLGNISGTLKLLQSFGTVKVLSSPTLSVMNNQTATLKVADNKVYFTVKADTINTGTISSTTFTTTPNAISVGFIMNVTPQISDGGEVTINIRPTITRITGFVNDPNPSLAAAGVINRVPEIQTREMESIIKITSGQIAVMGGLMQEEISHTTDAVPAISSIPLIGNLFQNRNDLGNKSELVIFLRPIVIKDSSIEGDYAEYRGHLPGPDYFEKNNTGPQRQIFDFGSMAR